MFADPRNAGNHAVAEFDRLESVTAPATRRALLCYPTFDRIIILENLSSLLDFLFDNQDFADIIITYPAGKQRNAKGKQMQSTTRIASRTIGNLTGRELAREVSHKMQRKYSIDVCMREDAQIPEQYHLFAYCTPQLCRRMQDYLAGIVDFL